ncbi:hypothetical protein IG631_21384 [Alternaria alternata]|nr:hypothetical protein IG631_21384 [Alternaria alternata]
MPRHSIWQAIEVIRRMVSDWPGICGQDRIPGEYPHYCSIVALINPNFCIRQYRHTALSLWFREALDYAKVSCCLAAAKHLECRAVRVTQKTMRQNIALGNLDRCCGHEEVTLRIDIRHVLAECGCERDEDHLVLGHQHRFWPILRRDDENHCELFILGRSDRCVYCD